MKKLMGMGCEYLYSYGHSLFTLLTVNRKLNSAAFHLASNLIINHVDAECHQLYLT